MSKILPLSVERWSREPISRVLDWQQREPVSVAVLTPHSTDIGKNKRRFSKFYWYRKSDNRRHHQWLGDRERFVVMLKAAAVPVRALEVIVPALDQMEERIAQLEKRGIADWTMISIECPMQDAGIFGGLGLLPQIGIGSLNRSTS
jgi:hypothetical protein